MGCGRKKVRVRDRVCVGRYPLAALIFLFSGVLPYLKLGLCLSRPWTRTGILGRNAQRKRSARAKHRIAGKQPKKRVRLVAKRLKGS